MAASLILVNPDHRLRGCLAELTEAAGMTLIEPEGEGLPALDAWMELVRAHPGVPVVIDLGWQPALAWELCCAVRHVDAGWPRSVLLTCPDRYAGGAWAVSALVLHQSAITAPDERQGFLPLLNAVASVLARAA